MKEPQVETNVHKNQLLGAFTPDARSRIMRHMKPVELDLGATVCEAGGLLDHVYFPEGCVLSLLTVLENGAEIECANIGREGAFGLFAAMYSGVSFNLCTVQLQGPLLRCAIQPLRAEFHESAHMQDLLVSYSETLLSQVMQTVACNSLHKVEERLSRWLLMMHDRAEGETLTYTHEFLARMMGANRTSVTQAAQSLQKSGLISYRRGLMQVKDRGGLEQATCECYAIVKKRFDAFLKPPYCLTWTCSPGICCRLIRNVARVYPLEAAATPVSPFAPCVSFAFMTSALARSRRHVFSRRWTVRTRLSG